MRNVRVYKTIDCHMTPEDWELFLDEPDAEKAAFDLNAIVEDVFSAHMSDEARREKIYAVQRKWKHVGAMDSEPNYVIEGIFGLMR